MKRTVAYLRVSTQRQRRSGLGIEAQRTAIAWFAEAEGLVIVAEFVEAETGKGSDALDRRPQLAAALSAARSAKCSVVVAKLDRLSRDVAFVSGLNCAIKSTCTTSKERCITRWEHEHVLEAVQRRLDEHPEKMSQRRETVEHPFGTLKARMGATHFLDEDAAAGRLRNGTPRAGLQPHPRHEHHGHPAAYGCYQSELIRKAQALVREGHIRRAPRAFLHAPDP